MSVDKHKWYFYYNNSDDKINSLLSNITLYDKSVLIATKKNDNFRFTKFADIKQFYRYYCNTTFNNHTYYAILTTSKRFIYLDIDYKLQKKLHNYQIKTLIANIYNNLKKFVLTYGSQFNINNNYNQWLIWNATRDNKFSLHILNSKQSLDIAILKSFAIQFNCWLHFNQKVPKNLKVDSCIYHANYQLWRLPNCHNGDTKSALLLYNSTMPLIKQFELSCMIDIAWDSGMSNTRSIESQKMINLASNNATINDNCDNYLDERRIDVYSTNYPVIQNLLQTNNIKPYKNQELIVKKHFCPVSQQKHQNNTGRIKIFIISNSIVYYVYNCMKHTCRLIMQQKFINLSHKWHYPWVIEHFAKINNSQTIKQIDELIKKLFDDNVLQFRRNSYSNAIIKESKLRFNTNKMIFSCFLSNDVLHTQCLNNVLYMYSKNKQHSKYYKNEVTVYCNNCKIFFNSK